MKNKVELILSYIIIFMVSIYGAYMFVGFGFKFGPHQMTHPAMVITFVMSCSFNVAKLTSSNTSKRVLGVSALSNVLTLFLAAGFVIYDPQAINKLLTTLAMGIITVLSILSLFNHRTKASSSA